jgi:hypothetical protein
MWLVSISPATPSPGGRTTLVGNGLIRDVTGQTIAKPVFWVKAAGETTRAGRGLLPAFRRIKVGPDQITGIGHVWRHASVLDDLTADIRPPVKGANIGGTPFLRTPALEQ